MNGKGSTQRPTDKMRFDQNHIEVFGDKCVACGVKTKDWLGETKNGRWVRVIACCSECSPGYMKERKDV